MVRLWLSTGILMLGLIGAQCAEAGGEENDADLPAKDPSGRWRVITDYADTTYTSCIGRPTTVVCGIDTYFGARVRYFRDWVDFLDGDPDNLESLVPPWGFTRITKYQIVGARRLTEADITEWSTQEEVECFRCPEYWGGPWRLGDVMVRLRYNECDHLPCPRRGREPDEADILLRNEGKRWNLMYFAREGRL